MAVAILRRRRPPVAMNFPASPPDPGPRSSGALFDLAAQSPALIALIDREGRVVDANRTFHPLFAAGFAVSARARIEQAIATVAREGLTLRFDAPMLREDGSQVWQRIVLSPAGRDESVDAVFALVVDI